MTGRVGPVTPLVLTCAVAVNDAPGPSAAVPKQSANEPAPSMGKVVESMQMGSPSEVVKLEKATFSCSLNRAAMKSPSQALPPALVVVDVQTPDAQLNEISRLHGVPARRGGARRESRTTSSVDRKKDLRETGNVECNHTTLNINILGCPPSSSPPPSP